MPGCWREIKKLLPQYPNLNLMCIHAFLIFASKGIFYYSRSNKTMVFLPFVQNSIFNSNIIPPKFSTLAFSIVPFMPDFTE